MNVPLEKYGQRRAERALEQARLARLSLRISNGRLASVAAAALAVWAAIQNASAPWVPIVPVAAFIALAIWHDRVLGAMARAERAVVFYERGIARIEDRWHEAGDRGSRFLTDDHLYARDLNIFGPSSLFQLLSVARTRLGEDRLAEWLKGPAGLDTIRDRQEAICELRGELDFREALAVGGVSGDIDTVALDAWASAPAAPEPRWLRAAAIVLAVGIAWTIVVWLRGGPLAPLVIVLALKMILTRPSRSRVARIVRGVERPLAQLDILAETLALIERTSFRSSRLRALRSDMLSHGVLPSDAIRRLKRLTDMLDWRRNAFFAPFSAALSWPLHVTSAIEQWRREFGPKVFAWLSAVAEHEALASLAAYAFEHPDDPFPEFVDSGPARFEGRAIGHPLIPAARMVRNDVFLTPEVRLLVISGSNMSGKSTLLRTVGVNVVMAMAGAPVRAQQLIMTPLAVGATLDIHDSLQAGRSRFYAEIARIRAILDLSGRVPTPLVLLDELFQGTNSHDRRIGAEALVRNLVEQGAIGLTTTHDLALTAIAEHSDGRALNVHFADELKDGEMQFDYRMRPGPVTHSNALALMRAVGLPVDPAVN